MRKEQQKALQEKQNNPDKHKDGHVLDVNAWLENTKDNKRISNRSNELEESMTSTVSNNDSWKSSSQILGARPLVPPGFKSTISEKNSNARALNNSHSTEVYSCHPFWLSMFWNLLPHCYLQSEQQIRRLLMTRCCQPPPPEMPLLCSSVLIYIINDLQFCIFARSHDDKFRASSPWTYLLTTLIPMKVIHQWPLLFLGRTN